MLIKCPECGKMRSDEAEYCVHCGCKRKEKDLGCMGVLSAVLIGITLFSFSESTNTKDVYITKSNVNYRSAPNGKVLGQLSKGTKISCVSVNGWCKTEKDGQSVYISLNVLDKNTRKEESTSVEKRSLEDVPVRQKKGLIAAIGE